MVSRGDCINVQVNDSLSRTDLCMRNTPLEIAAGALHLASLMLGVARELPYRDSMCWWDALGVPLAKLENAGHALYSGVLNADAARPDL